MVQIGEKSIDYNEEFRLFLTTRNPNPEIPPDAFSIVTEVNFTTTRAGLTGQVGIQLARLIELECNVSFVICRSSENNCRSDINILQKIILLIPKAKFLSLCIENEVKTLLFYSCWQPPYKMKSRSWR